MPSYFTKHDHYEAESDGESDADSEPEHAHEEEPKPEVEDKPEPESEEEAYETDFIDEAFSDLDDIMDDEVENLPTGNHVTM